MSRPVFVFVIIHFSFTSAREHPNVKNYGTDFPWGFRKPILDGGDGAKDEMYMIGDVSNNEVSRNTILKTLSYSQQQDKILRRFEQWDRDQIGGRWSYEEWNRWISCRNVQKVVTIYFSWRSKDGMLCRMNSDCQWWEVS